jgi:hypothetical protein
LSGVGIEGVGAIDGASVMVADVTSGCVVAFHVVDDVMFDIIK